MKNKKYVAKILYMIVGFLAVLFSAFSILFHCGAETNKPLDGSVDCQDEYVKPYTHAEKIDMIINNLKEKNEFIVKLFIGVTPADLRMVDYNKDGKKDLILIVGIPYAQSIGVGSITFYFVDNASNDFGKVDVTKVGRDINGYLLLEEKELSQEKMDTINSFYENTIDLAADVILYIDQVKEIQKQRGLDEESLEKRSGDEIKIISGEAL